MVVASGLGVAIGGDLFTRGAGTPSETAAHSDRDAVGKASVAVLQDGSDWLSEAFWTRRRQQRIREQGQSGYFSPQSNPFTIYGDDERGRNGALGSSTRSSRDGGHYRMVCVRLCDGYYFPISFSTTRDQFGRDEQMCQSKCSSETRLFYHSSDNPKAEDLTDRNGNRYEDLANAFVYRSVYNPSCQCRAQPWTDEARQRHAMYATEAWQKQAQQMARREERLSRQGGGGQANWRIVRPGIAGEDDSTIQTAAAAEDGGTGVNVVRGSQSQRMGLGGAQRPAANVQGPRTVERRDRSWKLKVFGNPAD